MKMRINSHTAKMLNEAKVTSPRTSTFEELMSTAMESGDMDKDELDLEDDELSEYVEDFEDVEINEDELFEDDEEKEELMSDEDLRIESLKIATNMAKLMANVTPEDIIAVADKVATFIRNHQIGGAEDATASEHTPEKAEEVNAEEFASSIENDDARTSDNGSDEKTETETTDGGSEEEKK